MYIRKASGKLEKFNPNKIRRTCIRAGASPDLARRIANQVNKRVRSGMHTREILDIALRLLKKELPNIASRYDLKGAMMRLGPGGFPFERFVAEVLKEYGFRVSRNKIMQGAAVSHEIDVVASKPVKTTLRLAKYKNYPIECKYHNSPGIYTGIKDVLYIYARFLDLRDGFKQGKCMRFDQAWLTTNTKFSRDAKQYALNKNIRLLGWKYPVGAGLENMLENKKLYPITVLRKVKSDEQQKLIDAGFLLIRDLIRYDVRTLIKKTQIRKKKLLELIREAESVLNHSIK